MSLLADIHVHAWNHCECPTPGRGQTVYFSAVTTKTINLLPNNTMYGEGHTEIDLQVAKIFRFAGTRANVGVDIYNLLNTDAITTYNQTFTPTAANAWLTPTNLVQPRFARRFSSISDR